MRPSRSSMVSLWGANLGNHLASKNKAEGQTEGLAVEIGYGRGNPLCLQAPFHTQHGVLLVCATMMPKLAVLEIAAKHVKIVLQLCKLFALRVQKTHGM